MSPTQPERGSQQLPADTTDERSADLTAGSDAAAIDPGQTDAAQRTRQEVADDVLRSDPNGNTPHGLAGGMGVSSERTGAEVGSSLEGTHGAQPVLSPPVSEEDAPPEQSPEGPEAVNPAEVPPHPFDPATGQPHSHG